MLSGNRVGSNQGGQSSCTPSGSANRFALGLFFIFPRCTVFSHVPTLLVFRWVSTSVSHMTADLMFTSSLDSTWHCTSQFSLLWSWARGFCCSSTSSSSRVPAWIPSCPGLLCLVGSVLQHLLPSLQTETDASTYLFLHPLGTSPSSATVKTHAKALRTKAFCCGLILF